MSFRFGGFELDPVRFELRRHGEVVAVQRLTLDTLFYLVEHRERVVTREDLTNGPWRGVHVSDGAFAQAISLVRRAVDDDGERQQVIKTVRGRGFRFVAPVESVAQAEPPHAARPAHESSFVGRERELELLREVLEETADSRGSVVLACGEPGIGKTSLVRRFAEIAADCGALVAWGACLEGGGARPLRPWSQIVRRLFEVSGWQRDVELAATAGSVIRLFPELLSEIGTVTRAPFVDSLEARARMFEKFSDLLCGIARTRPIVIVLEDLHAADEPSWRMLRSLVERLAGARVLVIATFRDTEAPTSHSARELLTGVLQERARIDLGGLEAPRVAALTSALVGEAVPRAICDRIADLTAGNPLLVENVARVYRTEGGLDALARVLETFRVPERAARAIRRNLDALPEPTRDLLAVASVVGREVELAVLAAITGLDARAIIERLSPAIRAGYVRERGRTRVELTHALVRDTAYESVEPERRAALHRATGEALESLPPTDSPASPARIAHHFFEAAARAGAAAKAVSWCHRAARDAMARLAYEESVRHLERAIDALALGARDRALELSLSIELAHARRYAGQHRRAMVAAEQAVTIARERGDAESLARAVVAYGAAQTDLVDPIIIAMSEEAIAALPPGESTTRVQLYARAATAMNFVPLWPRRDELVSAAVEMAHRLGDDRALGMALQAKRWCLDEMRPLEEAAETTLAAIAAYGRTGDLSAINEMRRWKIGARSGTAIRRSAPTSPFIVRPRRACTTRGTARGVFGSTSRSRCSRGASATRSAAWTRRSQPGRRPRSRSRYRPTGCSRTSCGVSRGASRRWSR